MGIYSRSQSEVATGLSEGLAKLVEKGDLKLFSQYPCIDHSDYFAVIEMSDDMKTMEVRFRYKDRVLVEYDAEGLKEGIRKLESVGFSREEEELVFNHEQGYRIVIGDKGIEFSRTRAAEYNPESILRFGKTMKSVLDYLLRRTVAVDPYDLAD